MNNNDKILQVRRYYGFDYLRAIMSLSIVARHMLLFKLSSIADVNEYQNHHIVFSDLINFHFILLTVPIFFLISLFLFSVSGKENKHYFGRRIERLVYLYIFWVGVWVLIGGGLYGYSSILPDNMNKILLFVITGGNSLFYFFFSLIVLTIMSFYSIKLSRFLLWILTAISLVMLGIFPLFVKAFNSHQYLIAYWNPLNFFPYVFIAALLADYLKTETIRPSGKMFKICIMILFIIFIITSVCEWKWYVDFNNFKYGDYAIPSFTRISVVAGTMIFFLLSFCIQHPPCRVIRFLSDYSLGLYCLHGFIFIFLNKIKIYTDIHINKFIEYIFILLLSFAASYIARRAFSKGLI